ncbi:MAG: fasciclin domain-containing protein [Gammaproteobacteria bacterium]
MREPNSKFFDLLFNFTKGVVMRKVASFFVLLLGSLFLTSALAATNPASSANSDVVDKAMQTRDLSTLVTAIKAAGLVDTLKGPGPFTIFAPSNRAFARLPKGTLQKLLSDKKQLAAILTYHVVSGAALAKTVENGNIKTVEGQTLVIRKVNGNMMVNNARITKTTIPASNGVIHIISAVLMPPKQ